MGESTWTAKDREMEAVGGKVGQIKSFSILGGLDTLMECLKTGVLGILFCKDTEESTLKVGELLLWEGEEWIEWTETGEWLEVNGKFSI